MTDSSSPRYPVFIVGMPRSGTTLLSCMLDAHSHFAISPETNFYTHCRCNDRSTEESVEEVWNCLQQQPGMQDMKLTKEELDRIWERLDRKDAVEPPDVLRALCSTYAERSGAIAWGEKTPDHLAHVPTILGEFPEAVVLSIVRDPRDVWLSLQDMPWRSASLPESAWKWRTYAQAMERYRSEYPERVREVRYEDVLEAPERVMRAVLEWIGVPFEEEVLAFHRQEAGPVDADREPWKTKVHRPIDPTNKGKWREGMTSGESVLVEAIARGAMETKEYEVPNRRLDRKMVGGLLKEVVRAAWTIVRRMVRRWRMPERDAGDCTPTWIREKEVLGIDGDDV